MLSNETKLNRINEKLALFDLRLEFGCFDLKTYKPILRGLENIYSTFRRYRRYEDVVVHLGVQVVNNKIYLYVKEIKGQGFNNAMQFHNFSIVVREIDKILEYCNHLELEVIEYEK